MHKVSKRGRPLSEAELAARRNTAAQQRGQRHNVSPSGRMAMKAAGARHKGIPNVLSDAGRAAIQANNIRRKGKPVSEAGRAAIQAAGARKKGRPLTEAQLLAIARRKERPLTDAEHASHERRKGRPLTKAELAGHERRKALLKGRPLTESQLAACRVASARRKGKPRNLTAAGHAKLREARHKQRFPKHHTKPETTFEAISQEMCLPLKYVGNGSLWIGSVNPDFVDSSGRKIAVEIFGDYWHTPLFRKKAIRLGQTEEGRKASLKKLGWKLIVFWESELSLPDVKERVAERLGQIYGRP